MMSFCISLSLTMPGPTSTGATGHVATSAPVRAHQPFMGIHEVEAERALGHAAGRERIERVLMELRVFPDFFGLLFFGHGYFLSPRNFPILAKRPSLSLATSLGSTFFPISRALNRSMASRRISMSPHVPSSSLESWFLIALMMRDRADFRSAPLSRKNSATPRIAIAPYPFMPSSRFRIA